MFKTVSNGQSIHQYIPPHLKRMFYRNPSFIHASHNGKDPYGFSTDGLVMYLPLFALEGSSFKSVDAYKHTCAVTGATWRPDGRSFSVGDDYIDLGSAFQSTFRGSSTIIMWVRPADGQPTSTEYFIGSLNATSEDGIRLGISSIRVGKLFGSYESNSNDAQAESDDIIFTAGQQDWHCVAMVCNSTTAGEGGVSLYAAGALLALQAGVKGDTTGVTFTDWTSDDELFIGAQDFNGAVTDDFYGRVGEVWLYDRALSAAELLHTHNSTLWRYQ